MKPQQIAALEEYLGFEKEEITQGTVMNPSNKNVYQEDAKGNIIGLNLGNNQISDISFLKDLTQLTALSLNHNQIWDISFLKDLSQLKTLDLINNKISNISFLKDLTQLTYLNLRDNQISDISFLKDLTQLTNLNLSGNQISDISFLKDLTQLTALSLNHNQISDIAFLKNLTQLTYLNLSGNQISDISFLKDLTQLTALYLNGNQISDYSFLKDLIQLTNLNLSSNQISDISFLKNLTQLTLLNLVNNQISDISFLKDLTQLTALYLVNNQISDISFLKDLTQLTALYLANNQISDISFLKNLTPLTNLSLSGNQISDISFLKNLTPLTNLSLSGNQISDISFLKDLTQLPYLNLSENQISNISFLKDLTLLANLYLSGNQISDISFLKDLTLLTNLDLSGNHISDIGQFEWIKKLPNLTLVAYNNPCFTNASILLEQGINHCDVIVNELKKIEEANNKETSITGYLPEKIVLLGNHSSGKSSLVHYLQKRNLKYSHDTTHILQIEDYAIKDEENVLPDAILYDFGGQDFYHGIYQTFLTQKAITLLLWNSQKNQNEKDTDSKELPIRNYNVNYWLGQWELKIISGQLLLIQTHKDLADSDRKTYSNTNNKISEEFYISLAKEEPKNKVAKNKAKHAALKYLQENIHEIIKTKREITNPIGKISKPYYDFVCQLREKGESQKEIPFPKNELRDFYKTDEDKRFEIDLDQLRLQGMLLIHNDNVWLNPVALAKYVHDKLLKKKVGNGILSEKEMEDLKFAPEVLKLLLNQKVIFKHEFGFDVEQQQQIEYIIPNYLPLIASSGIDYDLMVFGLDNPLFSMRFKNFLPFGFINQLICYFGRLPDRKKFWRDQLVFTISETSAEVTIGEETIDKRALNHCKVLIKIDFDNLKLEVFAVFLKESESYKNEITEYLYYVLLMMYNNKEIAQDFATYKKLKVKAKEKIEEKEETDFEADPIAMYLKEYMEISRHSKTFQIKDLYLSVDNISFVKQEELLALGDQTRIKTYTSDLEPSIEKPASIFQSFTPHKIKTMKKIFISYAKENKEDVNDFLRQIAPFKLSGDVVTWHCSELELGEDWEFKIKGKFYEADIIMYFVSTYFFSTPFILDFEVAQGIARSENLNDKVVLIPIILEEIHWEDLLGKYSSNFKGIPINKYEANQGWYQVVDDLKNAHFRKPKKGSSSDLLGQSKKKMSDLKDIINKIK